MHGRLHARLQPGRRKLDNVSRETFAVSPTAGQRPTGRTVARIRRPVGYSTATSPSPRTSRTRTTPGATLASLPRIVSHVPVRRRDRSDGDSDRRTHRRSVHSGGQCPAASRLRLRGRLDVRGRSRKRTRLGVRRRHRPRRPGPAAARHIVIRTHHRRRSRGGDRTPVQPVAAPRGRPDRRRSEPRVLDDPLPAPRRPGHVRAPRKTRSARSLPSVGYDAVIAVLVGPLAVAIHDRYVEEERVDW